MGKFYGAHRCTIELVIYAKSVSDTLEGHVLKALKEEFDHADD